MPTETHTAGTDWTVPAGVFAVTVTLSGERAQTGQRTTSGIPGDGGKIKGTIPVEPGDTLYLRASLGGDAIDNGGASVDIRYGGTALDQRIAVAAGGGSGGQAYSYGETGTNGGDGGPNTGEDGDNNSFYNGGEGGTQTTGGAAGGDGGEAGSFGAGGDGGADAGAGGAGAYGGGGGASDNSTADGPGGGGGSNYVGGFETVIANERGTSSRDYGEGGLVEIEYEPVAVENLQTTDRTPTSIGVAWNAPSLPSGATLDEYQVFRAQAPGADRGDYSPIATRSPGEESFEDTGLPNGTRYYYRVGAELTADAPPEPVPITKPEIPDSGVLLYTAMSNIASVSGYELSTPFDVTTASHLTDFSVGTEETTPRGVAWNPAGSKIFVVGIGNSAVQEYDVSTAFDITTATHSASFDVSSEEGYPNDIAWDANGTTLYVVGYDVSSVQEYNVSTAFDVTTASHSASFDVSGQEGTPGGMAWNADGSKLYVIGSGSSSVQEYNVSTAFDVTTASHSASFDVSGEEDTPWGVAWNADGSKLYVIGSGSSSVQEYNVSTAFDVTTASHSASFDVSGQDNNSFGVAWNGAPQYEGFSE